MLKIREATLDDVAAIAEVQVRGWQSAYRGQIANSFLDSLTIEKGITKWSKLLSSLESHRRIWIADFNGKCVGVASSGQIRDEGYSASDGEVYSLYLLPDMVRKGIGSVLFKHTIADLKKRGFNNVFVWVLNTNKPAHKFYEAMGLHADGATKVKKIDNLSNGSPDIQLDEIRYS